MCLRAASLIEVAASDADRTEVDRAAGRGEIGRQLCKRRPPFLWRHGFGSSGDPEPYRLLRHEEQRRVAGGLCGRADQIGDCRGLRILRGPPSG